MNDIIPGMSYIAAYTLGAMAMMHAPQLALGGILVAIFVGIGISIGRNL